MLNSLPAPGPKSVAIFQEKPTGARWPPLEEAASAGYQCARMASTAGAKDFSDVILKPSPNADAFRVPTHPTQYE